MMELSKVRTMSLAWLVVAGVMSASLANAALVSYWDLDGDAVATVGTDGTLVNSPTAVSDRNGVEGGAMWFSSLWDQGQYVEIAGGGGLDGAYAGTISMWVKWDGPQSGDFASAGFCGTVMGRQNDTGFSNNLISLGGTDPATAGVNWGSSLGSPKIDGTTPVGDGTWRHVAVVFQPHFTGPSELFLDGVSQGTALCECLSIGPTTSLTLGAWIGAGNTHANATMDDVAIFDDMLTAAQIGELYAGTKTPLTVGEGADVDVPLRGVVATASSQWGSRYANETTDGVGRLTTTPDSYDLQGHPVGMWLSNGTLSEPYDTDAEITYDLGEVTSLSKMVVYNYNEVNYMTRGVKAAEVYTSLNGVDWDLFGTVELDLAPGDATNPGQEVSLGGVSARYVKLDVVMASQVSDFSFAGLSEVDFYEGTGVVIPGDTNGDLVVDADDAAKLATNWGKTDASGVSDGDFNDDRAVNAVDASILAANWGDHRGTESAGAVPEPSALALMAALVAFAVWRRRHAV